MMKSSEVLFRQQRVFQILQKEYGFNGAMLMEAIKRYAEDIRLSVTLKYPVEAIANGIQERMN